jgi:predicted ATPase
MILEDAHWSDPTSLELAGRLIERIAALRVLLIVTFRPEFSAPWVGRPHVTLLTINRLTRREVGDLIASVAGAAPLPQATRLDIVERADGVPLFVEEMTKAVLEAESEDGARPAAGASQSFAVPASLQASLMARLDRLGPAKEIAQVGAVIGREFSHELVSAVARKLQAELDSELDRVVAAGLLFRQGVPPDATYLLTRWCRMPLTERCCARRAARCMRASPTRWRASSPRSPRISLRCWRVISPKRA